MKFYIFKETEKDKFEQFVTLYLRVKTPGGREDNPYDYINTLMFALADAYKCSFRWQDEKGKQSHIFKRSNRLLDFPGLDSLIKTGHIDK